jgi:hypothetical protein
MRIDQATSANVAELWKNVEPAIGRCVTLEAAGQKLATQFYERFEQSVVLARLFLTVRFSDLPSWDQNFVRGLADSAGSAAELKPETTVLSLVGTSGQEAEWRDRRLSKGHAGIPLISSAFVGGIPMIARLLKELGLPLDWLDKGDQSIVVDTIGSSVGLFFVENAAEATDDEGRKIIAAEEFVSAHNVKSVFGAGTAYADGSMIAVVVFCRDSLSRSTAENLLDLATLFKSATSGLVEASQIFASEG